MADNTISSIGSFANQRSSVNLLVPRKKIVTKYKESMPQNSSVQTESSWSWKSFVAFGIFTIISMITAILVVCLTTPGKRDNPCPIIYKTMPDNLVNQNSRPQSVASGEFNGDGKIDIVVVNTGVDSMTIFFGIGGGKFTNDTEYSTGIGSKPYSVAVGHFNNDNFIDIVVANYGSHSIGIFFGYGNGHFTLEVTYSIGISQPLLVLVHDVNNDDRLDIISVNNGTNSISIIFGYNNGTFSREMLYSTGYDSLPFAAAVGDFNNDKQIDIAIINYGTCTVSILLGYGQGLFAFENTYFIGYNARPYSIAVRDLDKDNQLDIIVGNSGTGTIVAFFGFGNGTFGNKTTFTSNIFGPQEIVIADVNNDDVEDIIITNSFNHSVWIFIGDNEGNFPTQITASTGVNSKPSSIISVELNNDKHTDVIVVDKGTNNIIVMLGYSPISFLNKTTYSNGIDSPSSVAVGHFNNDNRLDFVVVNSQDSNIAIFLANSNGGFSMNDTYSTGFMTYPKTVAIADFDNDTRLDIIVTFFTDDVIKIFFGTGNGKFGNRTSYSTGVESGFQSIAIGDVNNDGRLDIVVGNVYAANIGLFIGIDYRKYEYQTIYMIGNNANPYSVALGDFNNDNRLDIVFAADAENNLIIIFGFGNGTFINPTAFPLGYDSAPYSIVLADFNNDTKLDIAVACQKLFNIQIFLALANGTFANPKPYLTQDKAPPISIAVSDFNNDKILDIAVGHLNSSYIGIFIGIADGSFTNQITFSTGKQTSSSVIAVGNFNNDDYMDVVIANTQSNNIEIFIRYDSGGIIHSHTYSTGSATNPHSILVGDFNHDNQFDIAVANYGTGTISVLIAYGNITFAPQINYQTGLNSLPKSIVIADFNNDLALDMIVANFGKDNIGLFFGSRNGTFTNQKKYLTGSGSRPSSIAVSDFNNDKQLDIAIAQYGTDNIGIFLGYRHPDATRQKAVIPGSELHPCLIALADVNNDNLLDIVAINVTARSINIFLGFDNGNFSNAIRSATGNGSLIQSFSIGDFNNDNRLDIVAINIDGTDIEIFLGCGNGSFADQSTYPIRNPYGSQWIAVGDFNNDNRTDIVVSNSFSHNIYVFLANANGTFPTPVEYSNGDEFIPNAITVNDFNNDKQLDILVVNDYPDHRQLEIFLGYSNGMFTNKTTYTIPLRTDYSVTLLAVADFNNDNQQDIVVCYSRTDLIGIFIGTSLGNFASEKIYSFETNSNPQSLLIGDLNNDKRLDIIVALTYTNKVGIFLGFGDGAFELVRHYSTGDKSGPFSIGVADLNNDHVLDIVVSNGISGSIDIFFGFYPEIFFRHLVYATGKGSASHSVAIGDFNNDTRQDIVVTNSGNDNIGVFFGYGNGKFQNQTTYLIGIGSRPQSVAVGDFNNDSYLDIVVANYGNESIGIFLGLINGTFSNQIKYSIGFGSRPSSIIVFDFNKDNQLDIVITDDGTSNVIMLVGFGNGSFGLLKKYRTGYNSQPCALAIADFNNDFETDITIANCGTNNIGFISHYC